MRRRLRLPALFAATGGFTLASQTLLFREYLVSFQGNELGIAVFFSTWLFWIAAGATAATIAGRFFGTERLFLPLTAAYPVVFTLQLVLLIAIRPLAGIEPFELFPLGTLLLATLVANGPVSLLTGLLFQTGCVFAGRRREHERVTASNAEAGTGTRGPPGSDRPGQLAARLYAYEALGSFAGGVLVTALLWWLVPPLAIFAAVTAALLGTVLAVSLAERVRLPVITAGLLLLVLFASLATPLGTRVAGWFTALRWQTTFPAAELVEALETPYQKVSVGSLPGQTVFLANGTVVASSADTPDHAVTAAMLLAECPHARRVLVIGLGSEGLVPVLLRYPVEHLDFVTVDRHYHELALRHHDEAVRRAFEDERVAAHFGDPREFVATGLRGPDPRYDIVLVGLPDPETAYLNRFYTVDFYRAARSVLARRGVLAVRITAGENYAGTEVMQYGRSVFRSLGAVFEEVVVTPGEHAWLFASPTPGVVSLDPNALESRFRALPRRDESVPPEAFASLIPTERIEATRAIFEQTGGVAPEALLNTDARPVTLFLNLLILSAQSGAKLGRPLRALRDLGLPLFVLPLLVFLILRLVFRGTTRVPARASAFNGTALLAAFGAVAMCLSILLLVSFQNRFGHVFLSVGLLSALLMLGLFLGGLGGTRVFRRVDGFHFWPAHVVCAPVVVLCLVLPAVIDSLIDAPSNVALVAYHALFLGTGTACGLAFPAAGFFLERAADDAGWVAGALESADHWGGALGAAVVGIVAIPVLGVTQTCLLLALALGAVWALFAAEQLGQSRVVSRLRWLAPLRRRLVRDRRRHRRARRRAAIYAVVGAVVSVVLVSNLIAGHLATPRVYLDEQWVKNRYHAVTVHALETPFVHYITPIEDENSFDLVLLLSRAVAPDVQGYGGPINLLVVATTGGVFREVALVESRETPAYVHGIDGWLAQFVDWPLDRPITVGDDGVDVLTGATVTSRAVVDILEQTRERVAHDVLHSPTDTADRPGLLDRLDVRTGYVALALLLVIPLFLKAGVRAREAFLLFNLLVAGFLFNVQFSLTHVTRLLAGEIPSSHAPTLLVLTVGLLLLAVGFGALYCGYLCPFGAAQELLGRLGLVRGASPGMDRRARWVKFGVLAVALVVYFVARSEGLFDFDPLQAAFGFKYDRAMVLLLVLIGVYSLFYFRFWCRYLCPVGAFLTLFNKLGLALRWSQIKDYRRCDLGTKNRWDFDCLQCNRCLRSQIAGQVGATGAEIPPGSPISWRSLVRDEEEGGGSEESTLRSGLARHGRDLALVGGLVVALLLALKLAGGPTGLSLGPTEALGQPRDVDVTEIRRQIQEHRLSEHEALYYQRLDEAERGEPPEEPEPTIPMR